VALLILKGGGCRVTGEVALCEHSRPYQVSTSLAGIAVLGLYPTKCGILSAPTNNVFYAPDEELHGYVLRYILTLSDLIAPRPMCRDSNPPTI
jgi:hypothetical protein